MKFGRKSKNWAAAGRRLFGEAAARNGNGSTAVALEERDALLSTDHYEEDSMDVATDTETHIAGDPTQRMLTALSRFQRQVTKAEGGAPQASWTDECMAQFITGIEIAIGQSWKEVQRALTDTARVLQSYENAGRASECRRFLQESYEILCLMVGDLIVDKVRSGVLRKWNDCYDRAVADLGRAGLVLVEDDCMEEEFEAPIAALVEEVQAETESGPFAYTETATESSPGEAFDLVLEEDEAVATDFIEDGDTAELAESVLDRVEAHDVDLAGDAVDDGFFERPSWAEEPRPGAAIADEVHAESPVEAEVGGDREQDDVQHEEPEQPIGDSALAEEACPDLSLPPEAAIAAMPLEEAEPESGSATVEAPAEAAPDFLPESAPSVPEPNLMQEARRAMASGDVQQAKHLALRLAVDMALLEVECARKELAAAELLLQQSQAGIERAETEVAAAEQDLEQIQRSQEEQNVEQECQHEEIEELRGNIAQVDASIADLEAQIRALEEKRDAERDRLQAVHGALDEALAGERRIQLALDSLSEAENEARQSLEEARRKVAEHHEAHRAEEAQLELRRQQLEERNKTAAEIERLLGPTGAAQPQDELLF